MRSILGSMTEPAMSTTSNASTSTTTAEISPISVQDPVLRVRNLCTEFPTRTGLVTAVDGVSLDVRAGECLGVVGESGSGKSVTFLSVMGLVRAPGRIAGGEIYLGDIELHNIDRRAMQALRGRDIAMTMQDALTALNPAYTVSQQIIEVLLAHGRINRGRGERRRSRQVALELLDRVGIPSAEKRLDDYPHQFSGGMRQRIMLAIALACRPRLLIADEPTTALDVTIQAQVLELIAQIRAEDGMSVVLITHDLGVVSNYCDRVVVMYAGQVVESGTTRQVIDAPLHPYTRGLLGSIPRLQANPPPLVPIEGTVPELRDLPPVCRFHSRCPQAHDDCLRPVPMVDVDGMRQVRCIRIAEQRA